MTTDDSNFSPVTRAQWEAKATKDLRGQPLAKLTRTTADGIQISPLYLRGGGELARAGGPLTERGWRSVQELRHADPEAANAAARRDLELGAGGAMFVLDSELRAGRVPGSSHDGLVCDPAQELDTLLEGIDPRVTPVLIDAGLQAPTWADHLEEWIDNLPEREDSHEDSAEAAARHAQLGQGPARGGVIYDPLAALVQTGGLEAGFEGALGRLVDTVLGMESGLIGVSTCPYHDAGASDADELALALSSCAAYLRHGAGFELEAADLAEVMIWTLPVLGRPFEAIAKLRAARIVWAKFCAAAGHPSDRPAKLWIHATSSRREWTRLGPWVNLLRGTVGSFAGALGGADSVATAPFDGLCGPEGEAVAGLGRGSELGRRLALNTQIILREESHLGRVADPAAGSYYVEALSEALARAAWRRFQAIEAAGGVTAQLRSGALQRELAASAAKLREDAAKRRRPLTGLSTFPVLDEPATPEQGPNHSRAEEPAPPRTGPVLEPAEVAALGSVRLAAPFERLRGLSAAALARPQIYACALGSVAQHQARLDFAANAFRAGGLELVGDASLSVEDPKLDQAAAAQLRASGAKLAVICGRDEDYGRVAGRLVAALRCAGAEQVWIAGRLPRAQAGEPPPWGLDPGDPDPGALPRFVHLGCNLLAELEHALELLELTPQEEA